MKNVQKIIFGSFLIFTFAVFVNAQTDWKQFETQDKELSFLLPSNFIYSEDEGFLASKGIIPSQSIKFSNMRSITAFENGVSIWVESYEVKDGKEAFRYFPFYFNLSTSKTKDYGIGQNFLREITVEDKHYAKYIYFNSDKKFYIVGFGARDKNNPTIQNFLQSIKFNGKHILLAEDPKFLDSKPLDSKNLNILEKQKISPLDVSYEYFSPTVKPTSFVNLSEQSSPIVILTYPKPGYTDEAREKNEIGEVRVKILFANDGLVKKVIVVNGLKYGLTEKAVNATRRLRYLPAEDNGNPVSQVKTVVFNFSIY